MIIKRHKTPIKKCKTTRHLKLTSKGFKMNTNRNLTTTKY